RTGLGVLSRVRICIAEDGVRWTNLRSGPGAVFRPKLLILFCTALRYSLINRREAETASVETTSKNNTRMRLMSAGIAYGTKFDFGARRLAPVAATLSPG